MSDGRATCIRVEPPKFSGLDFAFGIAYNAFVGSIFAVNKIVSYRQYYVKLE